MRAELIEVGGIYTGGRGFWRRRAVLKVERHDEGRIDDRDRVTYAPHDEETGRVRIASMRAVKLSTFHTWATGKAGQLSPEEIAALVGLIG